MNEERKNKMSNENKKVTAEVSHECWKGLKLLAVQKEVSLQRIVQEVLERCMSKKANKIVVPEIVE